MAKKLSTIKRKAWAEFSKYIRLRDSDEHGQATCCTCGYRASWKELQAGHFIAGRCNSILFEENCVHAQCRRCNYQDGNGAEYFVFMENTYGREEIDRLRELKHKTVKFTHVDYTEIYERYKEKASLIESSLHS